jgi:ribosomal protein S13
VLGKTKVSMVLRSVRGVGTVKAARLMGSWEIAESRNLAGLGPRQRQALLDVVGY